MGAYLDLVLRIYKGRLKLWEGSLNLVKALRTKVQSDHLSFKGKQVLELGCGHRLLGIFACLEVVAIMHFQDFKVEVLWCLTISNLNVNPLEKFTPNVAAETRFSTGDWSEIHQLPPQTLENEFQLRTWPSYWL